MHKSRICCAKHIFHGFSVSSMTNPIFLHAKMALLQNIKLNIEHHVICHDWNRHNIPKHLKFRMNAFIFLYRPITLEWKTGVYSDHTIMIQTSIRHGTQWGDFYLFVNQLSLLGLSFEQRLGNPKTTAKLSWEVTNAINLELRTQIKATNGKWWAC